MQFAKNFTNLRNKEDLTIEELTLLLDAKPEEILSWENGDDLPKMETMQDIAKLFNVSIDDLVNTLLPVETVSMEYVIKRTKIFSNILGFSVFLIMLSIGTMLILSIPTMNYEQAGLIVLLSGLFIGIFGIIVSTINFEHFCKNNKIIFNPIKSDVKRNQKIFTIKLGLGILSMFLGIAQFILTAIFMKDNTYLYSISALLILIGIGIWLIINGGIIMSMYTDTKEFFDA